MEERPLSRARGRVIDALRDLQGASTELRDELRENELATNVMIDGLEKGLPLDHLLDAVDSERIRPQLTASLQRYERLRRKARLRMIAVALEQDMSVEDIQQRWAITRSLAVRNIREARGLEA